MSSSDTIDRAVAARPAGGPASGVRRCARPACPHPPVASMSYDYSAKTVYVGRLSAERDPSLYDLCRSHLDRISAPRGWSIRREPLVAVSPDGSVTPADWTRADAPAGEQRSPVDRGAI